MDGLSVLAEANNKGGRAAHGTRRIRRAPPDRRKHGATPQERLPGMLTSKVGLVSVRDVGGGNVVSARGGAL